MVESQSIEHGVTEAAGLARLEITRIGGQDRLVMLQDPLGHLLQDQVLGLGAEAGQRACRRRRLPGHLKNVLVSSHRPVDD